MVVVVVVVVGFLYPSCNSTQVRGFYRCNCPEGSAMQKTTGLCICLNNGTQLGTDCESGAADVRYVFSANEGNDWTYTNSSYS